MKSLVNVMSSKEMIHNMGCFVMICLFVLATPYSVLAGNFGDMAGTVGGQSNAIAGMAKSIAMLIGFVLVIAAIVMFATMKKTQTPAGIPTAMLIAGILLVSITAFVGVGSESLFGANSSGLGEIGIN
jgi:membrane protein insertase Oxa1/YidC/SpoIIIJ